jgi:hypothetical protein
MVDRQARLVLASLEGGMELRLGRAAAFCLPFGLGVTKIARERTAADDALRTLADPLPQLAVRGHHPGRRLDLADLSSDPVVRRLPALPHDHDLMAVFRSPGLAQLDELALGNVGPERAPDVLGVNQDRGHAGRF